MYFRGSTEKNAVEYRVGEEIRFDLELMSGDKRAACPLIKWETRCDDGSSASGYASGESGTLAVRMSASKSGFVYLRVTACALDGSPLRCADVYEGGAGADIDVLSEGRAEPEDYDDFWRKQISAADGRPLVVLEKKEVPSGNSGYVAYDIKLAARGEMPASGILTMPRGAKSGSLKAVIAFQGYSFASADLNCVPDTMFLKMNIHGFENLREKEYYDDFAKKHELFGFDRAENLRPESCYFLNVILRDYEGVRFLRSLPEYDGKGIELTGGSMGAMQSVNVASHMNDAKVLNINIPWLCDLGGLDVGRLRGWRPEPDPGVMYFDTVYAAKRVHCPVNIVCGLGDYVCPPSGEVVLFHNFAGEKRITFVQNIIHQAKPEGREEYTLL